MHYAQSKRIIVSQNSSKKRIIIGMTSASGSIYAINLLKILRQYDIETHFVYTRSAAITLQSELNLTIQDVKSLATHYYAPHDISATIASGSFPIDAMIIAPCSIRSMSAIQTGNTDNLLTRSADVCLKERRPLLVMVREFPFHLGHLRAMTQLTEMGAIIAPPVTSFYHLPKTIDDIVNYSLERALQLINVHIPERFTWQGLGNHHHKSEDIIDEKNKNTTYSKPY
jgi:4-hydroxy-3-polyprenylbenzoate decarboxylase